MHGMELLLQMMVVALTLAVVSQPVRTFPQEQEVRSEDPVTSNSACHCNGHSTCANGTSICNQPCGNFTRGPHCEQCVSGYYGNPVNGGKCIPCECNDQAAECHPDTGKCFCTTKGIVGDHCERCDTYNHYFGDPTNKGSCFYELTIDYQFMFNISGKNNHHYTQINFRNSPSNPAVDAEFRIACSVPSKLNITVKTDLEDGGATSFCYLYADPRIWWTQPSKSCAHPFSADDVERPILTNHNCTFNQHSYWFSKAEYKFGALGNVTLTTFYVYVYDFRTPLWIKSSFSQPKWWKLL